MHKKLPSGMFIEYIPLKILCQKFTNKTSLDFIHPVSFIRAVLAFFMAIGCFMQTKKSYNKRIYYHVHTCLRLFHVTLGYIEGLNLHNVV